MIGHIAMPAIDAGNPADPAGPPPATLSRAIATGFLRGTLGFEGLAVSDAIEMHGSVSRVRDAAELVVGLLNAGNDMLLFSDAKRDFGIIRDAVARGAISLARVDEACARVLALKERLGFAADPAAALPAADPEAVLAPLRPRFAAAAREVARRALTAVRMPAGGFPHLRPGDRVLAIHLRSNPEYNTDGLDTLLEERGMTVDRHTEANNPFAYPSLDLGVYRLILFCWTVGPTYGTNAIRPAGTWMRIPWFVGNAFPPCPVVHANFGTPYLVNDLPAASILVNAYSPDCHSQAAVADWLCGELEPSGVSPVDLDRPARIRELIRREYAGA
jgi:beta-N-acetylhexosaminidase